MLPAEPRHPGAEFRRSLSVAACSALPREKQTMGYKYMLMYNSTYFFMLFSFRFLLRFVVSL